MCGGGGVGVDHVKVWSEDVRRNLKKDRVSVYKQNSWAHSKLRVCDPMSASLLLVQVKVCKT